MDLQGPEHGTLPLSGIQLAVRYRTAPVIGKVMSVQQRYSEIKRVIVECLMVNPYIKSIDTIDIQHEGDTVDISITLTTIYGEVSVDV